MLVRNRVSRPTRSSAARLRTEPVRRRDDVQQAETVIPVWRAPSRRSATTYYYARASDANCSEVK